MGKFLRAIGHVLPRSLRRGSDRLDSDFVAEYVSELPTGGPDASGLIAGLYEAMCYDHRSRFRGPAHAPSKGKGIHITTFSEHIGGYGSRDHVNSRFWSQENLDLEVCREFVTSRIMTSMDHEQALKDLSSRIDAGVLAYNRASIVDLGSRDGIDDRVGPFRGRDPARTRTGRFEVHYGDFEQQLLPHSWNNAERLSVMVGIKMQQAIQHEIRDSFDRGEMEYSSHSVLTLTPGPGFMLGLLEGKGCSVSPIKIAHGVFFPENKDCLRVHYVGSQDDGGVESRHNFATFDHHIRAFMPELGAPTPVWNTS